MQDSTQHQEAVSQNVEQETGMGRRGRVMGRKANCQGDQGRAQCNGQGPGQDSGQGRGQGRGCGAGRCGSQRGRGAGRNGARGRRA